MNEVFDTGFEHGKGIKTSPVTEKLTLSDCFKYPNASILNTWSNGNSKTDIETFLWRKGENIGNNISDCKLILKPLSSLTEKEKNYMNSKKWICNKPNDFWNGFEEAPTQLIQIAYAENRIEVIDYLRSINIDIDGLKEKGVAVYERD